MEEQQDITVEFNELHEVDRRNLAETFADASAATGAMVLREIQGLTPEEMSALIRRIENNKLAPDDGVMIRAAASSTIFHVLHSLVVPAEDGAKVGGK